MKPSPWIRLARLVALSYVSVAAYAWFCSEDKIFLPHPANYADAKPYFKLKTAEGVPFSAVWIHNPTARYTLLYSHGNAEDLGDLQPILESYEAMGFSVLAYDYEGYGTSGGRATERGAIADIDAAYAHLTGKLKVSPDRIIVVGHSLGGGPSADLVARHPEVAGLVLESTFTSAFRVLTHVPVLPFDRFDTIGRLDRIKVPLLVIHGRQDDTIPFWHGEAIYAAARAPKTSLWLDDAGHDDVVAMGGDRYARTLQAFAGSLQAKAPHSNE